MDSPVDKPLYYGLSVPAPETQHPIAGVLIVVISVSVAGLVVVLGTVLCCVKRQPKTERVGEKKRLRNMDIENGNGPFYPNKLLVNLDPTSSTQESELDSQVPDSPVRRPRAFSRASITSRASIGSLGSGVTAEILGRRRSSNPVVPPLPDVNLGRRNSNNGNIPPILPELIGLQLSRRNSSNGSIPPLITGDLGRRRSSNPSVQSADLGRRRSSNPSVPSELGRRRSSIRQSVQLEELDLSMYGEARDDELRGINTILARGRLCFSVVHDVVNECLVVNILRAQGLVVEARHTSKTPGRIDSSVRVCLQPSANAVGHCTGVCRNDTDPTWEESFCFQMTAPMSAISVLRFWVQDHDR